MSLLNKVAKLARTPQGQKLADKAMKAAKDPKTRAQIDGVRAKLGQRGKRG